MRFQFKTLDDVAVGEKYQWLTPSRMVADGFPYVLDVEVVGKTPKRVVIRYEHAGREYIRNVVPANLRDL